MAQRSFRHPEARGAQRRASKGDGPGSPGASAASFEGRCAAASG